ncbi:MAG: Gfo/Idh/MocA family oxidoreductase [Microbacterium sp.]
MTMSATRSEVATIRSGIVGGGFMGRVHARAIRATSSEVTALASSSADSAARAAAALGAGRAEPDVAALLSAPDVEVVHVCTPNASHARLARAALEAGKHVVCEKPLAVSLDEARALADDAAGTGLVAAVPFVYRYHPVVRELRARILAGELGPLITVDCAYLQDWMLLPDDSNWRALSADGGPSRAFADIGSHVCDLLEFVTGERIVRLTARTRRFYDTRSGRPVANEDAVTVLVELSSGAIGTLLVSQMAAGRKNALSLELHGAAASARFEQERPDELWLGGRQGNRILLRDPASPYPDAARLSLVPAGHPMGYQDAFNAFVADVHAAVRGARPEGLPTFADGVRAAALTEAVLWSAQHGEWADTAP